LFCFVLLLAVVGSDWGLQRIPLPPHGAAILSGPSIVELSKYFL
jgi:hypothetical protein